MKRYFLYIRNGDGNVWPRFEAVVKHVSTESKKEIRLNLEKRDNRFSNGCNHKHRTGPVFNNAGTGIIQTPQRELQEKNEN